MCAQSQFEISDVARMIHSAKRGHKIVAVLNFKFDESYNDNIMCVGGWIANELEWKRLETRWQKRIDFENSHSGPDQQITRYHASHLNAFDHEFKNWDKVRSLQFSKKLIHMLSMRKMGAIAMACDMDAIREVFPKGDEADMKRRTYVLCIKQLMVDIAHAMEDYFPGDTVVLVHDHGDWDEQALKGYNLMIDDPAWKYRSLFEGLMPKTGKDSVGLQAADMIAYEVFRGVKDKTKNPDVAMRGAIQEMLSKQIPMSARWINLDAAKALYSTMKESGKYPTLDEQGVT
jgi:Protein of unknown function (DUF3800)